VITLAGVTWTDEWTFIATAAAAAVTFLAVLVALFGPAFQQRWSRPEIAVEPSSPAFQVTVSDRPAVVRLLIANKRGRDTARDVEVFAYATRPITETTQVQGVTFPPGGSAVVADQANLNFDDPRADRPGRSTASIPSGFAREVNFATVAPMDDVDSQGRRGAGRLALYPTDRAETAILREETKYSIWITVAGSNFDAVTYLGHLLLYISKGVGGESIEASWTDFSASKTGAPIAASPWG